MAVYVVSPAVIIGRVEGLSSTYGPGGFAVGIVPEGESGRPNFGGPLEEGPWGYVYGLAGVIDNRGGTGATHDLAKQNGTWLESVKDGDVLVIGNSIPMALSVGQLGKLSLDPVDVFDAVCATCGFTLAAHLEPNKPATVQEDPAAFACEEFS